MAENGIERVINLVSDDADVKAAAKQLALAALDQAQELLFHGNDAIRMRIIGAMLPAFQRSLSTNQDKNKEAEETRKEFQALRDAVMGTSEDQPGN